MILGDFHNCHVFGGTKDVFLFHDLRSLSFSVAATSVAPIQCCKQNYRKKDATNSIRAALHVNKEKKPADTEPTEDTKLHWIQAATQNRGPRHSWRSA